MLFIEFELTRPLPRIVGNPHRHHRLGARRMTSDKPQHGSNTRSHGRLQWFVWVYWISVSFQCVITDNLWNGARSDYGVLNLYEGERSIWIQQNSDDKDRKNIHYAWT